MKTALVETPRVSFNGRFPPDRAQHLHCRLIRDNATVGSMDPFGHRYGWLGARTPQIYLPDPAAAFFKALQINPPSTRCSEDEGQKKHEANCNSFKVCNFVFKKIAIKLQTARRSSVEIVCVSCCFSCAVYDLARNSEGRGKKWKVLNHHDDWYWKIKETKTNKQITFNMFLTF